MEAKSVHKLGIGNQVKLLAEAFISFAKNLQTDTSVKKFRFRKRYLTSDISVKIVKKAPSSSIWRDLSHKVVFKYFDLKIVVTKSQTSYLTPVDMTGSAFRWESAVEYFTKALEDDVLSRNWQSKEVFKAVQVLKEQLYD